MSVTLNVSALKTRESTSDPWQGTVVKSDAILDAGTITYDGTETYTAGTVGEELNSQRNTLDQLETSRDAVEDAVAYVQNGDTASRPYTAGQFVYLKNHATLAEGLYTVNSEGIPQGTSVTGHLTADSSGGLNTVNDLFAPYLDKYIDTPVNISSYNAADNYYTCPSDGYAYLYDAGSTLKMISGHSAGTLMKCVSGGELALFVKKGMMIYATDATYAYFYPMLKT